MEAQVGIAQIAKSPPPPLQFSASYQKKSRVFVEIKVEIDQN